MGEKHTKGPWEALKVDDVLAIMPDPITGLHDTFLGIAIVQDHEGERSPRRVEANARLIAAAPDLLAAVWALVEHFERVDGDDAHKAVIKQATDAIGKATNRPSPTGEDSPANEGEA